MILKQLFILKLKQSTKRIKKNIYIDIVTTIYTQQNSSTKALKTKTSTYCIV